MRATPHTHGINAIISQLQDFGLREYQESIHYLIFALAVLDDAGDQTNRRQTINHLFTLRDLAEKLRQLEIVSRTTQPSASLIESHQ